MSRLRKIILKNNNHKMMNKIANVSCEEFDSFILDSGDIIGFGCRIVNNKPIFQVYQESIYNTFSYYDGNDYDEAIRLYQDLLTAFKGVTTTEDFSNHIPTIEYKVNKLKNEKENDDYNFQRLKSDPLFLGVNRNDF